MYGFSIVSNIDRFSNNQKSLQTCPNTMLDPPPLVPLKEVNRFEKQVGPVESYCVFFIKTCRSMSLLVMVCQTENNRQ